MCIRDRDSVLHGQPVLNAAQRRAFLKWTQGEAMTAKEKQLVDDLWNTCLLYTSMQKLQTVPVLGQLGTRQALAGMMGDSMLDLARSTCLLYTSLPFLDRLPLTVKSDIDPNTDANVFKGRARFMAGFNNWRCIPSAARASRARPSPRR